MPDPVDQTAKNIQSKIHDDGFLGTGRNDNLHEIQKQLEGHTPAEVNQVIGKLSDADLRGLADDINHGGIFGAQGLSGDEKRSLMNEMARELDGTQLARLSNAFGNRSDVTALGDAVSRFASDDTKVAYVKALAPNATDRESKSDTSFGMVSSQLGDKEAYAVGEVLTSLKNNPGAFNTALASLSKEQLGSVVHALENERWTSISGPNGMSSTTVTHDPAPLKALLDAAAASGTVENKAALFQAGSTALADIRGSSSLFVPNPSMNASSQTVTQGLTAIMNSDTRGVTDRLNTMESSGRSLAGYLKEVVREDPTAGNGTIGRQIAQLQGSGTGMTAKEYIGTTSRTADGKEFYRNAQTLGYYSGAVQAGINSLTSDAKTQGEIVGNIFGTALTVGTTLATGLPVAGRAASGVFNGLSREVIRSVVADIAAGNKSAKDAFAELALPRDAGSPDRYRGPAEPYFQGTESTVILRNQ